MAAEQTSDGIESAPSPAVSSIRLRFEKLAADSSSAPTSNTLKPPGSPRLAPVPPSPRMRPHAPAEGDHDLPVPRSPALRPATSASDLKAGAKRPPPPPPGRPSSRAPSPANPRISPLVRPVPDSGTATPDHEPLSEPISASAKAASISRRPPPPPPPSQDHSAQRTPGVSSLIKQFGTRTGTVSASVRVRIRSCFPSSFRVARPASASSLLPSRRLFALLQRMLSRLHAVSASSRADDKHLVVNRAVLNTGMRICSYIVCSLQPSPSAGCTRCTYGHV
ncbi:hypothetical protein C8Q79DRAFT_443107 [Trametes meyenii]|nr:hypothetical protein C8Q79DRAFT_443107 [Trametes meyenii]